MTDEELNSRPDGLAHLVEDVKETLGREMGTRFGEVTERLNRMDRTLIHHGKLVAAGTRTIAGFTKKRRMEGKKNPAAVALGQLGGKAKVPKGVFRIRESAGTGGESASPGESSVVEVWNGRQVVATIYPTEDGVRIVAPGLTAIHGSYDGAPAVTVTLR